MAVDMPRPNIYQERYQVEKFPIQDDVYVEAYWRDDRAGKGPAASVYVHGEEVLRLDCFDGDQGHFHVNIATEPARWYYPPAPASEHIERAMFDLTRNLQFCTRRSTDEAVRRTRVNKEELEAVVPRLRSHMLALAARL